ncbi:MAG: DUF4214 domain-containing protein, partial [Campylobacter sp.]|nr:DUF4214 domain-containing protein [Campylobacter sp.]
DGASRKDLVDSFIKAVIAQKAANTQDYQKYATKVAEQSSAFVDSLYTKLLGRQPDEAGKAYWSGVIADGASYADVVASFANAAFIQGKDTADGVTIANKLEVANYATTNLTSFSKLTTKEDIEAIKARLVQAIENTKSNTEAIADAKKDIDSDANTYKAPGSVTFTTKTDDKLGLDANGKYTTTKATNFNGTLNLDDATKGTIQKTDAVNGNPDFANGNILTVNVTGTTKDKITLNLADLPTTSNVKNLDIKASTARVSGDISNEFTNSVTIDAGYTSPAQPYASEITVKHNLNTYNAGAQADKLTVASGASIDTVNMGAGNDIIILEKGAGAAANQAAAKVTNINAGAGNDTIELATVASGNIGDSGDYTSIKKITNVETIKLTGASDDTSGAQISYDAIKDSNKKFTLTTDSSGSGALTIKAGDNTDIDVSQITNGEKNGSVYNNKVASLTISDVKANATVKLRKVDGGDVKDKIVLAADNGTVTGVNITGFDKGTAGSAQDKIQIGSTFAGTGGASALGVLPAAGVGAAKDKAYVKVQDDIVLDDLQEAKTLVSKMSDAAGSALVILSSAKDNKEESNIYLVTGTTATITDVKLIATVDVDIKDTTWKMAAGVLELV